MKAKSKPHRYKAMNLLKLSALAFAALVSVSAASAQVITNYGQAVYPGTGFDGNWGGTGYSTTAGRWYAQTFTPPVSGSPVFAYNVQFSVLNGATPSFTTAIYEWTGTTVGAIVANTSATFSYSASTGFSQAGANVITNPGMGTISLDPAKLYAIVVQRTDNGASGGVAQIGQASYDPFGSGTAYTGGRSYVSANGSSYIGLAADDDFAFWVSFDPNSLSPDPNFISPVPEPAVGGSLIGAAFVGVLLARRRRKSEAQAAA